MRASREAKHLTVKIAIEDEGSAGVLQMDLAEDTTVDEIIEAAASHWKKPRGAYVLRWHNALLRGEMTIAAAGVREAERLVLMADPEGG